MQYLLFLSTFLYLSNWVQIGTFLTKFLNPKISYKLITDKKVTDIIKKKTGVTIEKFYLLKSDKLFGGMFSPIGKPMLMLSEKLYKDFNKDELEYVLLHETAHHLYKHTIQDVMGQGILGLGGIYLIKVLEINILPSAFLGIVFALAFIQFAKWHERQAENYAAKAMDNPKAMISAANKLKTFSPKGTFYAIRRRYFIWNVMPSERIAIAQREVDNRKK